MAGSQQWTLASGRCAVRWTGQGQRRAVGVLQGGQERNSGVVAVGSEAGKGCVKEGVILLLLKKLGKKLLCKEGKGRKKERSGRWLLLRISVAHTVSLNGTRRDSIKKLRIVGNVGCEGQVNFPSLVF